MKVNVMFAELHGPLFLNGANLGLKLDASKRVGLKMVYDREQKELEVTYNGLTAYLPNISYYVPSAETILSVTTNAPVVEKRPPGRPPKAQVSTPTSHVFDDVPGDTGQRVR